MIDDAGPIAPNFERYAQDAPHSDLGYDFPDEFVRSVRASNGVFLDVGSGDGAVLSSALSQGLLSRFSTIFASDISEIRVARLNARGFPGVTGVVASADRLPVDDASADYVLSHQVIEHVPDDRTMAAEIARVLKPGATAFITSVSKRWYGWYFYRCNGKFRLDPTHVREYDRVESLAKLFADEGLEITAQTDRKFGHRLDRLLVVLLVRFARMSSSEAVAFVKRNAIASRVSRLEIPIPGYYYAEVLVRKPSRV